jgi:hypothetical protein
MKLNKKLKRGLANFFGCIGIGIAIVGFGINNSAVIFVSTVEMLICLTVRNHFHD